MEMVVMKKGTTKYTTVVHEKDVNFNAPHHYKVCRTEDTSVLCEIDFQEGPIKECGVNGVANEDLINMCIERLEGFQNSQFACLENQKALEHLQEAIFWLRHRTNKREERDVEGTHTV